MADMRMHPGDYIMLRDGRIIRYEEFGQYHILVTDSELVVNIPYWPSEVAYIKIGNDRYVPVRHNKEWMVMKLGE